MLKASGWFQNIGTIFINMLVCYDPKRVIFSTGLFFQKKIHLYFRFKIRVNKSIPTAEGVHKTDSLYFVYKRTFIKISNGPDELKEIDLCFECNYDCNLIQMHVHPEDTYSSCTIGKLSYFTGSSAVRQWISSGSPDRGYLLRRASAIISAASKMFTQ